MLRKLLLLIFIFLFTSITVKAQTIMTDKQQALVTIAGNAAKGNISSLRIALNTGLDHGLSINEAKEALAHLYAYTGFPRSLNALTALQDVLKDRAAKGLKTEVGREASPLPKDYDALQQGTRVQTQLGGGKPFNYTFAPQTDYYLKAHLFGDIFARDTLSFADRELVTIAAIAALPGCEPQLLAHVRGSRNMGVSDQQLKTLPTILREHVGEEEAVRAEVAIAQVLGFKSTAAHTVDFNIWPKGEPNPYGKFFTGKSYLASLGPVNNVTFEPGCRNNWHIHHKQVQVLICVSGRGWYQEWGKEAIEMRPGTVIAIPSEKKHWHGAARNSWFQHLTYHTDVAPDASNEWLEPVTDEQYNKLP